MSKVLRFLAVTFIIGLIVLGIDALGRFEHSYSIGAEVSNVYTDMVQFTDDRGYTWSKKCDSKTYELGEKVKLVMHDNTTDSIIKDDYILKVKK